MSAEIWTVLPVRGMMRGKSRLAPALDERERAELNRWLFARTLAVLQAWYGDLARCVIVSRCAEVYALAHAAGAAVLCEAAPASDQNETAALGAAYAFDRGARRVMALPSDLPELSGASLDALAAAAAGPRHLAIAPDTEGTGTNAVVYGAGPHVRFHFGPQSCARYLDWADRCGLTVSVHHIGGVAFDLDTPVDLTAWRQRNAGQVPGVDSAMRAKQHIV
jgi:2-phospho-L-lactate/phosphoenolpyruvate guanylyltransferase